MDYLLPDNETICEMNRAYSELRERCGPKCAAALSRCCDKNSQTEASRHFQTSDNAAKRTSDKKEYTYNLQDVKKPPNKTAANPDARAAAPDNSAVLPDTDSNSAMPDASKNSPKPVDKPENSDAANNGENNGKSKNNTDKSEKTPDLSDTNNTKKTFGASDGAIKTNGFYRSAAAFLLLYFALCLEYNSGYGNEVYDSDGGLGRVQSGKRTFRDLNNIF